MKVAIVLLACVAAAFAQHHNGGMGDLIHHEVVALIQADPNLTVDNCVTKCDALFDLIDQHDEDRTDDMCKHACDCEINKTCDHHMHVTHPTHHPHPTHP
ncbi:uncharacterized protein LOC101862255 [Aplysia californica]|uniref:Uncharacterized protein LOC101862255 n=1 Tax=Aplysia californica TaxID=6500 RepID=A0ABM0JJ99_APLCA|nr:uncharacterized protein LOC101862255 [Aplysia californica]